MRTTFLQRALGISLLAALVLACSSGSSGSGGDDAGGGSSGGGSSSGGSSSGTASSSGGGSSSGGSSSGGSSSGGSSSGSSGNTDGGSSGNTDSGSDGGRPSCTGENSEPNDTEATATALAEIDDCDSSATKHVSVGSGTIDVDYFRYLGKDTVGCVVDPTAQLNVAGAELCIFVACKTGAAVVSGCSAGAAPATSPGGKPGCCIQTTDPLTTTFGCAGSDDSADVYLRVKQLASNPPSSCLPYEVQYHF